MDSVPLTRLRDAVARGIITEAQLDAILGDDAAAVAAPEAEHGFNAVSVAYYLGAAAVVFALGWFLVEQWERVGAVGVLAIAAAYAALFVVAARWLVGRGFRTAASMATLLAVCTAPLAAWAVLDLAGWWPERMRTQWDELRLVPLELTLVAAALVALRRVRFALLALPVAAGVWLALVNARVLTRDPTEAWMLDPYLALVGGTLFIAAAYHVDRWQARSGTREDYAFWPYVVGVASVVIAVAGLWEDGDAVPWLAIGLALLSIAVAVRLERRTFLVAGAIGVFAFLAHLAGVFRDTSLFPLVLAAVGAVVIGAAVWLQRRYPRLVRGHAGGLRRPLPGGIGGPLAALAISLALVFWARTQVDEWEAEAAAKRREAMRARPASAAPVRARP